MFDKKMIILCLLIVFILSISAVNAADENSTDLTIVDDTLSVEDNSIKESFSTIENNNNYTKRIHCILCKSRYN